MSGDDQCHTAVNLPFIYPVTLLTLALLLTPRCFAPPPGKP